MLQGKDGWMCFQVLAYMGCEKQILLADVFVIERLPCDRGDACIIREAYHSKACLFFFSSG